jgi:hypothetical protein
MHDLFAHGPGEDFHAEEDRKGDDRQDRPVRHFRVVRFLLI